MGNFLRTRRQEKRNAAALVYKEKRKNTVPGRVRDRSKGRKNHIWEKKGDQREEKMTRGEHEISQQQRGSQLGQRGGGNTLDIWKIENGALSG